VHDWQEVTLTGGAVGERQKDVGHVFAAAGTRQTFGDQRVHLRLPAAMLCGDGGRPATAAATSVGATR